MVSFQTATDVRWKIICSRRNTVNTKFGVQLREMFNYETSNFSRVFYASVTKIELHVSNAFNNAYFVNYVS